MSQNLDELLNYAKLFSGLTPEDEICLTEIAPIVTPHLNQVTESFYAQLNNIPEAANFLQGRVDSLKIIHLNWLENLFSHNLDIQFVKIMYKTGDTHFKIRLPSEFMVGGMTLLTNELIKIMFICFGDNPQQCQKAIKAVNAVTGFSLTLMMYSFYASTAVEAGE